MAIHWPSTGEGQFQKGMAYVALSRCQQLEDVNIIIPKYKLMSKRSLRALIRKQIVVDHGARVQKENMDIIELERRALAKSEKEMNLIVSYLNVRKGLLIKKDDVETDDVLLSSDIFGIGETCLEDNNDVQYDGFNAIFANVRNGQGSAVYVKNDFEFYPETFCDNNISAIFLSLSNIDLIFLYLSKQYSWNILRPVLEKWINKERKVAILGDMNWQYDCENPEMKKYLEQTLDFKQIINVPTHDQGYTIDHIYINEKLVEEKATFTTEAVYYSDHDIIQLKVPKL